jgi:hypothetical protein
MSKQRIQVFLGIPCVALGFLLLLSAWGGSLQAQTNTSVAGGLPGWSCKAATCTGECTLIINDNGDNNAVCCSTMGPVGFKSCQKDTSIPVPACAVLIIYAVCSDCFYFTRLDCYSDPTKPCSQQGGIKLPPNFEVNICRTPDNK